MIDSGPRTPAAAAASTPPPAGGNVTALVTGILDDAQKLIRQQMEMLKAEVKEDFRRSKRAAEFGGVGIVLLTVGFLGLVMFIAYLFHDEFGFSLAASWGITALIFLITGGAFAATSYVLLERFNPLPDKTFHALQENITWQTK
jgi:uncharacterized membrane protein YqjE